MSLILLDWQITLKPHLFPYRSHFHPFTVPIFNWLGSLITFHAASTDPIPSPQTAVPQPNAEEDATKPLVLVIDDQKTVREAIADILELKQISTLLAGGGLEGIALFKKHQTAVSIVVLDLSMPGMNGEETFQRLRQISPNLPVLFTSGYDKQSLASQLPIGQNIDFLQKPFQFKELVNKVERLLGRSYG